MQNIKKYFMTLALLLTAVGGAWAQSSLNVVEIEAPANWEGDNNPLTAAELTGFKASTLEEARAWKGAPTEGMAMLFYAFDGNDAYCVYFNNGEPISDSHSPFEKNILFGYSKLINLYYTAEPTEWSLTPDETGKKWTLDKMPASNVELQVEYYAESNLFLSKDALADKANIAVKNGETDVAFGDDGKSTTTVTEGNTVTAKFTGKKVLGMKVEKKAGDTGKSLAEATVGMIIGSNGKAYAVADKDNLPSGVTAAAKVCYIDGNGHGLALALTDEVDKMNWSTAQTTCDAHTPAITGGKWMLASKGEWNNMISAAGSYSALRDGFSSVGGTNMESGGYWSSTEDDSSDAWNYYFSNGLWSDVSKNWNRCVRACLAF